MLAVSEAVKLDNAEELLNALKEHVRVRDKMGGSLYWNILNDECCQIANRCSKRGVDHDIIGNILGHGNYR